MYSVIELKTPQQRLKACIGFAAFAHLMLLVGIHFPDYRQTMSSPQALDLLLIPIDESKVKQSKPKPQTLATAKVSDKQSPKMDMASTLHKNHQSLRKPTKLVKKRTISASHHEPQDAEYLARWQAHIEDIGNLYYPEEAQKNGLKGSLRLMVALNKDGSVKKIDLRQSSGHKLLDDAAIQIVQKAAPFEPLPNEISKDIEVLEIIRTWQFRGKFSTNS